MSWHSVLTERGASLLAASIGTSFYLTKISLGCGITTEDLSKQTSLINEKATATSVKIYSNENSSNVTLELKNKAINEEFELQQIGIWAKQNESDDDILYMIVQDDSENPTTIKSAIDSPGYTYAATINIVVDNSSIVNATVTEAGTAKYDDVFDDDGFFHNSKIKIEDISSEFITSEKQHTFAAITKICVSKQGKCISGSITIEGGDLDMAFGEDSQWTIANDYKPKEGFRVLQTCAFENNVLLTNNTASAYIENGTLNIHVKEINTRKLIVSFSYICG